MKLNVKPIILVTINIVAIIFLITRYKAEHALLITSILSINLCASIYLMVEYLYNREKKLKKVKDE